ncbi:hypothetical protein [Sinorhizobium meliloti]|uniref:hypothetical protein n=1 Tax=Rhizobium meliloti TaxID=382 RepID=UPI001AEE59E1|nr:hypothetical protein [Sinorhizobium meliloti]
MTHTVHFTPEARDQLATLEVDISGQRRPPWRRAMSIPSWTIAGSCKPFRTEARAATIFGQACERLGFAGV